MGKEKCWTCHKIKNGVELRATDDRMCQQCFERNEVALALIRSEREGQDAAVAAGGGPKSVVRTAVSSPKSKLPKSPAHIVKATNSTATAIAVPALVVADPKPDPNPDLKIDKSVKCCAAVCNLQNKPALQQLTCSICLNCFHGQCIGINQETCEVLLSIVDVVGWTCNSCRDTARAILPQLKTLSDSFAELKAVTAAMKLRFDSLENSVKVMKPVAVTDVTGLSEHLEGIQAEFASLKAQVSELKTQQLNPVVWPKETEQTMRSVLHTELADKERRRRNLIITGLSPVDGVADADVFSMLCETHLSIKPVVVRDRCRRLGKPQPGRVQPLIIVLEQELSVAEILKQAPRLRRSDVPEIKSSVFINPDLTRAERQVAYELRLKRRQRRGLNPVAAEFSMSV